MGKGQSNKYILNHNGSTIECDRVTAVLGATKASAGLALWYGREERKGIQDILARGADPQAVLTLPTDDDDDLFASRRRDESADSGTGIHALIYCDATDTKLPDDLVLTEDDWRRYKMWEDFKNQEGIEYVDSELRVFSPNLMVAGTMDLSVLWRGVLWGLDTKTGALRRDAATQMVTYWMLRYETLAIADGNQKVLDEIADAYAHGNIPIIPWPRLGVNAVGDDGIEIYEIDPKEYDRLARNFLFRLQVFRDDQTLRPFRRLHPQPKLKKDGTYPEVKWLRAS
jgi:hypothetical protein